MTTNDAMSLQSESLLVKFQMAKMQVTTLARMQSETTQNDIALTVRGRKKPLAWGRWGWPALDCWSDGKGGGGVPGEGSLILKILTVWVAK